MSDTHTTTNGASIDPNGTSVRGAGRLHGPLLALAAMAAVALLAFPAVACASGGFGIESVEVRAEEENGTPATQAGSHPYALTAKFALDRKELSQAQKEAGLGDAGPFGQEIAEGDPKDVETTLPAGVAVNLLAVAQCSEQELAKQACPASSQVGDIAVDSPFALVYLAGEIPVFNIAPSSPRVAGALGFTFAGVGFIAHIIGSAHAGGDYGISALAPGLPQGLDTDGLTLTLWGDPSAASHCHQQFIGGPCVAVPAGEQPFLTLPTSCPSELSAAVREELSLSARADSWQEPGVWTPTILSAPLAAMTGCKKLSFTPSIEVRPETSVAETPTGVSIALKIPQVEALGSLAEANLREAVVTLPANLVASPSAVSGLAGCSEAQVGLSSPAPAACPEASKVGTVQARTPLLDHPVGGSVYLAQQGNAGPAQGSNPFGSLIALYVVVEGSGVQIKAAGEVSLNQLTGQLTTRFRNLPQLPYSEMTLNLFGGPRASLVPDACGLYTTSALLSPWSAPESDPSIASAEAQSSFTVDSGCNTGEFAPAFTAGTTSNQAGGYSPFVTTFTRQDSEQGLASIQEHIPTGLLGSIAHVPLCGEPQAQEGTCGPESRDRRDLRRRRTGHRPVRGPARAHLPDRPLPRRALRPVGRRARARRAVRPRQRDRQGGAADQPPNIGGDGRHRPASSDAAGRAGAYPQRHGRDQPPRIHLQPDQLQPQDDLDHDGRLRGQRRKRFGALPGHRLRDARLQAAFLGLDLRPHLESRWGEP